MPKYPLSAFLLGAIPPPPDELFEGLPPAIAPLLREGARRNEFIVWFTLRELQRTRSAAFRGRRKLSGDAHTRYIQAMRLQWKVLESYYINSIHVWPEDLFDAAFPGVREERDRLIARRNAPWEQRAFFATKEELDRLAELCDPRRGEVAS